MGLKEFGIQDSLLTIVYTYTIKLYSSTQDSGVSLPIVFLFGMRTVARVGFLIPAIRL